MKALLSNCPVAADIDDVEAHAAVEGDDIGEMVATEVEILAKGTKSFDRWWERFGLTSEIQTCDEAALEAYLAGYLSMALEVGYQPQGGVA